MIPVALIVAFGLLLLTLGILWLARSTSLSYADERARLTGDGSQTLAYDVLEGVDPATVVAALGAAGYHAVEDDAHTSHRILVGCPSGRSRDREPVRAAIQTAVIGRVVRFVDEPEVAAT